MTPQARWHRLLWHNRRQRFPSPPLTAHQRDLSQIALVDSILRLSRAVLIPPRQNLHLQVRPYIVSIGATRDVLERRTLYGGRKGNSARRKLGIQPSTSVQAARAERVLRALQRAVVTEGVPFGGTDLIHWSGPTVGSVAHHAAGATGSAQP